MTRSLAQNLMEEAMEGTTAKKTEKHAKDPRYLLAFGIGDLEQVLPWERKTIKELESVGLFPKGIQVREGMQKIHTRKVLEAYLEVLSTEAMEQLPRIAATIQAVMKTRDA
jgi:predicted house-cleaning noncanonical NTP pyrophosphatase (MazG superfamily)